MPDAPLALFGGDPVVAEPPCWPQRGPREARLLREVLDDGQWSLHGGTRCTRFESRFAALQGLGHVLTVSNGTVALQLACEALGLGPGDEVIVPGLTWQATAGAVLDANAVPVLVDVDPDTWCLDPVAVEAAVTERTRADPSGHRRPSVRDDARPHGPGRPLCPVRPRADRGLRPRARRPLGRARRGSGRHVHSAAPRKTPQLAPPLHEAAHATRRPLATLGATAFCVLLTEGAVADWGAVFLTDTQGASPGPAAAAYLAFTTAMAVGRLTGDRLTAGRPAATVLRGGSALGAAGLAVLLGIPTLPGALTGCALLGVGLSCLFPLLIRQAAAAAPATPSSGVAAVSTLGYLGFLAGPPLIGLFAEATTLHLALCLLLLAPATVVLLSPRPRVTKT